MFKINLSEIRYNNTQPKINDVLDRRYLSVMIYNHLGKSKSQ